MKIRLITVLGTLAILWLAGCKETPPETLQLADIRQPAQGLVYVADRMGYFKDENLVVSYRPYPTGRAALTGLHASEVDVAHVFDMPVATDALAGKPLRIIGTLIRSNQNQSVIGRRDRGIATAADLAGKRVGLVPGSATDYLLFLLCKEAGIDPATISRVAIKPNEAADKLARGEVDAVATWQPHAAEVLATLPAEAVSVLRSSAYTELSMLVIRPDSPKSEALRRLLRALAKAEDYIASHPAEAEALTAAWLSELPAANVHQGWVQFRHQLRLDNLLLTTLGNEAIWLAGQKSQTVPDFTQLIAPEFLAAARPPAVTVK